MTASSRWQAVKDGVGEFDFSKVGVSARPTCRHATDYQAWCDEALKRLSEQPTRAQVERLQLRITQNFHDRRRGAPRGHRGEGRANHQCLYGVWCAYMDRLHEMLINLPTDRTKQAGRPPQIFGLDQPTTIDAEPPTPPA